MILPSHAVETNIFPIYMRFSRYLDKLGAAYSNEQTVIYIRQYIEQHKRRISSASSMMFMSFLRGAHNSATVNEESLNSEIKRLVLALFSGYWAESRFKEIRDDLKRFKQSHERKIPLEFVPVSYLPYDPFVTIGEIQNLGPKDIQNIIDTCFNQLKKNRDKLLSFSKTPHPLKRCTEDMIKVEADEEEKKKHLLTMYVYYLRDTKRYPSQFHAFFIDVNTFMSAKNEALLESFNMCCFLPVPAGSN